MMSTFTRMKPVTGTAIKQAIETRDGRMLAGFYADHAVTRVIDRNNPPSRPREIKGKAAITAFWADICGRAMTHRVDVSIAEGDKLAFTQACRAARKRPSRTSQAGDRSSLRPPLHHAHSLWCSPSARP